MSSKQTNFLVALSKQKDRLKNSDLLLHFNATPMGFVLYKTVPLKTFAIHR
jgi:hypothetical protein